MSLANVPRLTFRETLPSSPPKSGYEPIILSDNHIETSTVMENSFDLIYPVSQHDLSQALVYRNVIRLARQWKCLHALESLFTAVHQSINTGRYKSPPDYLFIIAVGLEDAPLLVTIVAKCSSPRWDRTWNDLDYVCHGISSVHGTKGRGQDKSPSQNRDVYPRVFALGAWSLEHYLSIPTPISWYLFNAQRTKSKTNWEFVADTFKSMLRKNCMFTNNIPVDTRADQSR
jgi:hypothetical protein